MYKVVQTILKVLGVTFVIVIIIGVFFGEDTQQPSIESSNIKSEVVEQLETYTVSQIARDYEENTVKADSKYKDKTFKLKAVIDDINTDMTSTVYINARSTNEFRPAMLYYVEENRTALGELKKGQEILSICTGSGDMSKSPIFSDCELQ